MSYKKQIFKISILKKLLSDENSCVCLVPTTRILALPPFFLNDMKSGIFYILNNMLKKYDRSLGGIVVGYQNIKVLMDENTGIIPIGTSETEVNISVEFYIFQPKIGSHLEGVINKKSNNHIGCLVHHYFNATILKPEDVDYEDWICKEFNVDDKIIFKVKDLDFTHLLPYIEGTISDRKVLNKIKSNVNGDCSMDNNVMDGNTSFSNDNEFSGRSKISDDEKSEIFSKSKKKKSKNKKVSALEDNIKETIAESNSSFESKKKKKKKKEKERILTTNSDQGLSPKQLVNDYDLNTNLVQPARSKNMRILCSPITQSMNSEPQQEKILKENGNLSTSMNYNTSNKDEGEKKMVKGKGEKSKQDGLVDFSKHKRVKTSYASPEKETKSKIQTMMEELVQKQLNMVKKALNMTDDSVKKKEKAKNLNKNSKTNNDSINGEERGTLTNNVPLMENSFSSESRKAKNKKEKLVSLYCDQGKCLNGEEASDKYSSTVEESESQQEKREKKMKKKKDININNNLENPNKVVNVAKCLSPKQVKSDNVLLEPITSKDMRIPFSNAIAQSTPLEPKKKKRSPQLTDSKSSTHSENQIEKKEKKPKKRPREEVDCRVDLSTPKRIKMSDASTDKETKSKVQSMMEELVQKQLNMAKEALNMSDDGVKKKEKFSSSNVVEDNIFNSTLVKPVSSKKMRISFCSPIPKPALPDVKIRKETSNHQEPEEKEKKKKRKKEKPEDSNSLTPKKIKSSPQGDKKSTVQHTTQYLMEELLKQQLNLAREALNISVDSVKKKEKVKKGKRKSESDRDLNARVNGGSRGRNSNGKGVS